MNRPTEGEWRLGEENVGGGFNIYAGPLPVARTSILSAVNATRVSQRPINEGEAKANAALIVDAVNAHRNTDVPTFDLMLEALRSVVSDNPDWELITSAIQAAEGRAS